MLDFYNKRNVWNTDLVDFEEIDCEYPLRNRGFTLEELEANELTCNKDDPVVAPYSNGDGDYSEEDKRDNFMGVGMFFFGALIAVGGIIFWQRRRGSSLGDPSGNYQQMNNGPVNYADLSRNFNDVANLANPTRQPDQSPLTGNDEVYA